MLDLLCNSVVCIERTVTVDLSCTVYSRKENRTYLVSVYQTLRDFPHNTHFQVPYSLLNSFHKRTSQHCSI
jgi:hypothetical protein